MPTPGPRPQVLPAPSPAPQITLAPALVEEVPFDLPHTPAPAPDLVGRLPSRLAFQPSVAWVNDGQHLAVVPFGK